MIIDFHAHYPDEPDFATRLVEMLPSAGIDRICLCSAGAQFGHAPNETVLAAARAYPDKISALALIELGIDSPGNVDHYAAEGYAGFKTTNPTAPYDTEAFFP